MTYKFFRLEEFNCTHTNLNEMDPEFLEKLDELRERVGFPFIITSGYRDATHPAEARKAEPGTGTHCQGIAADIAVSNGFERMNIVHEAIKMGFSIGVARTFVHVDDRKTTPVMWTYS
jgi:zinc D-Ala-D-Ala carboxypeptidase